MCQPVFLLSKQIAESGGKDMSEDVKRMRRELAYQGTVLKVYKDHMKFSNGNTEDWDFIHHDGAAAVIPVMDDGKIRAIGTHEELMENSEIYKDVYKSQQEGVGLRE